MPQQLITSRHFGYQGTAEAIKQYLGNLGHQTDDVLDPATHRATHFSIRGTTINVGYHPERSGGRPVVWMLNAPDLVAQHPDWAEAGLRLYPKLYQRFRRKKTTR